MAVVNIRISKVLKRALNRAIARGDPFSNLEFVGVSYRILNMLAESEFHVVTMEQLLNLKQEQLLIIPNFGLSNLQQLIWGVANYDKVEIGMLKHQEKTRMERDGFDYFQTIAHLWELQSAEPFRDAPVPVPA